MKAGSIIVFFLLALTSSQLKAQMNCATTSYSREKMKNNLSLADNIKSIERFTQQIIESQTTSRIESSVIKIPVVVHILYHSPSEKVNDAAVAAQLEILNKCFRRLNVDAANTPERFKPVAADCEIEFQLATSDPFKRYTSGIVHKYTPVTKWTMDDKMKFSAEMGDDAWDTKSYLNIWVCNMEKFAGYSSVLGGPENVDGIVMGLAAFTESGNKTIVHEAGHWLGLKHLWGDEYCGDDGVEDTPKQASYTTGCPTNIRITCGNGPNGDMYSNYMDFTNDACTNLFTEGQKARMRALFVAGAARNSIMYSKGLDTPLIFEIPLPEQDPKWLEARLYPNPATTTMMLDLSYDIRWVGKTIFITNALGQNVMNVAITSKNQQINVSSLQPGLYFLAAKKEDGESIKMKFVKL